MDLAKNKKRSVTIAGHRTSITLEEAFWTAFKQIAQQRNLSTNKLIAEIDQDQPGNLSSAIRLFVLEYYKSLIPSHPSDPKRH